MPRSSKKVPLVDVLNILDDILLALVIPNNQAIESVGYSTGSTILNQWTEAGEAPEVAKWALRGFLHHHKKDQGLTCTFDRQDLQDLFFMVYDKNPDHRLCKKLLPLIGKS